MSRVRERLGRSELIRAFVSEPGLKREVVLIATPSVSGDGKVCFDGVAIQDPALTGSVDVQDQTAPGFCLDIMPSLIYDGMMHRTTINLDEGVFRQVKRLAERSGQSMARTVEALLREALRTEPAARPELPLHPTGARPGVDIADRDRLYDLMEGR